MVALMILGSGLASQLVPRIGARPLIITGSALAAGGMFWIAQLNEHSSYVGGFLFPTMVTALGMGLIFVPMSLVSLAKVPNNDTGVASSLFNVGQQVGGSIGLAVLGTIAWSAVASSLRSAAAAAAHAPAAHLTKAQEIAAQTAVSNHALAYGFSRGFLVSAGIMVLALIIGVVMIRVTRQDLAGIDPMVAPADPVTESADPIAASAD
jgi:MFS family permease